MPVKKSKSNSEKSFSSTNFIALNEIDNIIEKVVFLLKESLFFEYYEVVFEIMNDFFSNEENFSFKKENLNYIAKQFLPESLAHYTIDKNLIKIVSIFKGEFIKNNYDVNLLYENLKNLLDIVRSKLTKELSTKEILAINEYYVKDSYSSKYIENKLNIIDMIKNTIQDIEKELKGKEMGGEKNDEDEDEEDMTW